MICVEENTQAWLCFKCELVLSSVANKGSHSSDDTTGSQAAVKQEAEPLTAQRRRELEHYLKLKRYRSFFYFHWNWLKFCFLQLEVSSVCSTAPTSWVSLHVIFFCFSVRAGCRTGAASGLKTRTWSLIPMRRSLRHLPPNLKVTEKTKNCGKTGIKLKPQWNIQKSHCCLKHTELHVKRLKQIHQPFTRSSAATVGAFIVL